MTGALLKAGHDVLAARNLCDGCPDDEIVALACRHDCIILTEDTDFGELVVRRRMQAPGIILLRLSGLAVRQRTEVLLRALSIDDGTARRFRRHLVVVETTRVRFRPLPDS